MKKLLLIPILALMAFADGDKPKPNPCKQCACNPAYCPVGTAD